MGKEKWSPDVRYGLSSKGPERDAAERAQKALDAAADRLTREYEAEARAAGRNQ